MEQKEIEVKSGSSGASVSFNPLSKNPRNTIRVHSGRSYYRKKKVWLCNDKKAHHNLTYFEDLEKEREEKRIQDEKRAIELAETNAFTNKLEEKIKDSIFNQLKKTKTKETLKILFNDQEFSEKAEKCYTDLRASTDEDLKITDPKELMKFLIHERPFSFKKGKGISLEGTRLISKDEFLVSLLPRVLDIEPVADELVETWKSRKKKLWLGFFTIPVFGIGIPLWVYWKYFYKKEQRNEYKARRKVATRIKIHVDELNDQLSKSAQPILNIMCVNKLLSSELSSDGVPKNKYLYGAMTELFGSNVTEYKEECTISIMSSSVGSRKENRVLKKYVESEDFWNISSKALAMSVAESDGEVSKEEAKVIDQIADLSAESIKIYNQIVEFDDEEQVIINTVNLMGSHSEDLIAELINNLLFLSEADGEISDSEIEKIKSISGGCGLSDKKFKSVFERYVPNNT